MLKWLFDYQYQPRPQMPSKVQQQRLSDDAASLLDRAKELHLDVRRLNVDLLKMRTH